MDEWTFSRAAAGGHLEILKWLHVNKCPWDEYVCVSAVSNGHLEVLNIST